MPSRYTSIPFIILRERMFATIWNVDLDWGRVTIDTAGNEILWDLGRTDLAPVADTKIHIHNKKERSQ